VATTLAKHGGDFLGEPKRRLLWACPFVSLIHPGFWLASLVFILPWLFLTNQLSAFTQAVAAGFLLPSVFFGVLVVITLRRVKRIASEKSGSNNPLDR
jgi:hypothetical protein